MLERVGMERRSALERDELCRHRGCADIYAERELSGVLGYFGEENIAAVRGV